MNSRLRAIIELSGEHANSMQKDPQPGVEPRTFLLHGNSATNCTTVQASINDLNENPHKNIPLKGWLAKCDPKNSGSLVYNSVLKDRKLPHQPVEVVLAVVRTKLTGRSGLAEAFS
ncbi:hypothetical protein XENOCAPTIV_027293 [Xenoophorus captivus]|uniref:Uncharacterized protein n=1 Tax=Xenoophorus captivus TaxID=1517983 RepID=A0ABV0QBM7_9TELE